MQLVVKMKISFSVMDLEEGFEKKESGLTSTDGHNCEGSNSQNDQVTTLKIWSPSNKNFKTRQGIVAA